MKMRYLFLIILLFSFTKTEKQSELDQLVNDWHLSATQANYQKYFDFMTEDFVFLGTAPGERWNKKQFSDFSKPYFDKGKAWDFKPSNRNWIIEGKIAWFDEDLDTWMKGCRGSGILKKVKGKWKIVYYNLTVLIENEKIKEFIKLRE